jgi:hypothetical protein
VLLVEATELCADNTVRVPRGGELFREACHLLCLGRLQIRQCDLHRVLRVGDRGRDRGARTVEFGGAGDERLADRRQATGELAGAIEPSAGEPGDEIGARRVDAVFGEHLLDGAAGQVREVDALAA